MASGALPPALGAAALAGASVALGRAAGAGAAGAGPDAAALGLPIWSERMVTVWIFLGSPDPASGAAGGCPGPAAFGGADGDAGTAGNAGAPAPSGAAAGAGRTGIVETTRGGAFAGWIATGCSSRDTSFSGEPGAAPAGGLGIAAVGHDLVRSVVRLDHRRQRRRQDRAAEHRAIGKSAAGTDHDQAHHGQNHDEAATPGLAAFRRHSLRRSPTDDRRPIARRPRIHRHESAALTPPAAGLRTAAAHRRRGSAYRTISDRHAGRRRDSQDCEPAHRRGNRRNDPRARHIGRRLAARAASSSLITLMGAVGRIGFGKPRLNVALLRIPIRRVRLGVAVIGRPIALRRGRQRFVQCLHRIAPGSRSKSLTRLLWPMMRASSASGSRAASLVGSTSSRASESRLRNGRKLLSAIEFASVQAVTRYWADSPSSALGTSRTAHLERSSATYRISFGASTPSSASPDERTVTTPCTSTRRATVICRSFWIMKRKCGFVLPSV